MAITKAARSKIFTLVQEIKKLLVLEIASQLQQFYGIRPDGSMLLVEQLPATEPEILHTARLLRQRIDYIKSNIPSEKNKEVEAIKQLLNEQAFSILNRFATLRMAEERGIIKETIRKEYNSEGFQIFDSTTGQGAVAEQYIRYKWYLHSIFDELAIDLPSVFDRFSPYALIFPGEKAMRSLLAIINNEAVTMHREEGKQPMNLWREDETIGWIYQYYNSREEISEMRDASSAPRNSRELAVRNQFFTPRYVVQFLTDNSLGRIWYEMTKGKTELIHKCQYLIRRPKEMFLDKGNTRPENAEEETDYIEHREIKDPREILMLDPACGSMHFGLYSFDLFEQIYTEAWDNHPELMLDLRNSITRKQYINQIPEFIIRYNIHGVDIDPRALQIAALSLWLRAQKSFEKLNLEPGERPQITKSNLVLAEAMPGNVELLSALVKPLDAPLRKLVTAIWDLMKMAGETGLLLRIEEEIDRNINEIADELNSDVKSSQLELGADDRQMKAAERAAFYSTKKYRDSFLENAASEVFRILKELSETATNGEAYQKLLFADDAARGFAFIELCRKKYDVVLMNPPFGAASEGSKKYIDLNYPTSKNDLASVFIDRMLILRNSIGAIGAITTRSIFYSTLHATWRKDQLICKNEICYFFDLGGDVLDAMVEVAAYVLSQSMRKESLFIRATKEKNKENSIRDLDNNSNENIYNINSLAFLALENAPFSYWINKSVAQTINNASKFERGETGARQGLATSDNNRFVRNRWEISEGLFEDWFGYLGGDDSCRWFYDQLLFMNWRGNGNEVKRFAEMKYKNASRTIKNEDFYFRSGLSWAKRTAKFQPYIVTEGFAPTTGRFLATFSEEVNPLFYCSLWNSEYYDYIIKLSVEKDFQPTFITGNVNNLPDLKFSSDVCSKLIKIATDQIHRVKFISELDEKSVFLNYNDQFKLQSLRMSFNILNTEIKSFKIDYLKTQEELNALIYRETKVSTQDRANIESILFNAGNLEEGKDFDFEFNTFIESSLTILIGGVFGRWDLRIVKNWKRKWNNESFFKSREHCPFLFGKKESTLDLILPEYHEEVDQIYKQPYPIDCLKENASTKDVVSKLKEVIAYFWPDSASTIEFELQDHFGVSELTAIFTNPNKFFDAHLKDYSRNKRISPIYWPISTSSGSYTIWLYYPKLTDQTLVSVINNFLQPKIDEVNSQIKSLSNNSNLDNNGLKELNALKEFDHELEEMKKELLRITALPYKPNHDDGVLITAAPLFNLFRHAKWRKSTEDCWKALEKGEYDWAHLACSIWPDRVSAKCKKDLSMAIAHGLENICEIKPKEKKAKPTKPAKKGGLNPQLNFEE
jgi:hypothetical protein